MNWNIRDDLPIYSQLIYQIKVAIASGKLIPGDRLASVRDLALEAKVNPNTMQRALTELEREGFVYSQRTSGRYITEDTSMIDRIRQTLANEHVEEFFTSMKELGFDRDNAIKHLEQFKEAEDGNT